MAYNNTLAIKIICEVLGIDTQIYLASTMKHGKGILGLINMVKQLGGDTYVNLPGGKALYNQDMFGDIKLEFLETQPSDSILCDMKYDQ